MKSKYQQKEQEIWLATKYYMSGKISSEELEAIEKPDSVALKQAMLTLSERSLRQDRVSLIDRIKHIWRKK